jgi:hypothetical protein
LGELIIYGASDDLIEIEGNFTEEFSAYPPEDDESLVLAISDGTVLRVRYDEDGIWRFTPTVVGSSSVDIEFGKDDRAHTDRVTLTGDDLSWVVLGTEIAK